jgi:hypothetical protein
MYTPQALSEKEINEVAELLVREDIGFGCETLEDALITVRSYPIVKFSDYITDGPGYSGEIFVMVGGILTALVIFRNKEGQLQWSSDE